MGSKVRKNAVKQLDDGDQGDEDDEEELCTERDVLFQLHCKRGEPVTVQNYRELFPFIKSYNKYICVNAKTFVWREELKNILFLVKMMKNLVR
jgi:hypothetical protein